MLIGEWGVKIELGGTISTICMEWSETISISWEASGGLLYEINRELWESTGTGPNIWLLEVYDSELFKVGILNKLPDSNEPIGFC